MAKVALDSLINRGRKRVRDKRLAELLARGRAATKPAPQVPAAQQQIPLRPPPRRRRAARPSKQQVIWQKALGRPVQSLPFTADVKATRITHTGLKKYGREMGMVCLVLPVAGETWLGLPDLAVVRLGPSSLLSDAGSVLKTAITSCGYDLRCLLRRVGRDEGDTDYFPTYQAMAPSKLKPFHPLNMTLPPARGKKRVNAGKILASFADKSDVRYGLNIVAWLSPDQLDPEKVWGRWDYGGTFASVLCSTDGHRAHMIGRMEPVPSDLPQRTGFPQFWISDPSITDNVYVSTTSPGYLVTPRAVAAFRDGEFPDISAVIPSGDPHYTAFITREQAAPILAKPPPWAVTKSKGLGKGSVVAIGPRGAEIWWKEEDGEYQVDRLDGWDIVDERYKVKVTTFYWLYVQQMFKALLVTSGPGVHMHLDAALGPSVWGTYNQAHLLMPMRWEGGVPKGSKIK